MKLQKGLYSLIFFLLALALAGCDRDGTPTADPGSDSKAVDTDTAVTPPDVDLHTAVVAGNADAVRLHIRAGSDINEPEPFGGSSPLISAATFGRTEIARLLIDAGADLDFTNADGSTALHSAAFFCRPEILEALLEAGADKSVANNHGSTPYDTVAGPFEEVKPFYDMIGASLAPMGLALDYDRLRENRPLIAAVLQ